MVRYNKLDYGPDPNNPWTENLDNGWGPFAWPKGVPENLMGTFQTADGTNIKLRKELVPLAKLLVGASEELLDYQFHTLTGGNTGGYNNRPIRGGTGPSTHSRARAIDTRATDNPQSRMFVCTIPPAVVKLWESCGWYWGGRYSGVPYDTQHFSYIRTPISVSADIAKAKKLIAAIAIRSVKGMELTDKIEVRDPLANPIDQKYEIEKIYQKQVNYLGSLVNSVKRVNEKLDTVIKLLTEAK